MDLKLEQGAYWMETGRVRRAEESEAALQRVQLTLATRKGSFLPKPEFGSRLHLLLREKPGARETLAVGLVQEALAGERDLTVESVRLEDAGDGAVVLVAVVNWLGESLAVRQTVG